MITERCEVPGLTHYSYVLISDGQAAVIDPKRDVDSYIAFARKQKARIAHVFETHNHADYVSGAKALGEATGAQLWVKWPRHWRGLSIYLRSLWHRGSQILERAGVRKLTNDSRRNERLIQPTIPDGV